MAVLFMQACTFWHVLLGGVGPWVERVRKDSWIIHYRPFIDAFHVLYSKRQWSLHTTDEHKCQVQMSWVHLCCNKSVESVALYLIIKEQRQWFISDTLLPPLLWSIACWMKWHWTLLQTSIASIFNCYLVKQQTITTLCNEMVKDAQTGISSQRQ